MKTIAQTILLLLLVIPDLPGYATEVSFSASAPSAVTAGERFRLTYTLNAQPEQFDPPSFDGFRVISGPSQSSSTSTQIINNQVTTTVSFSYNYVLQALEEGSFTIPRASVTVDGKNHTSNPVDITVTASTDPSPQTTPQPQQRERQETVQPSERDIFVRAVADNTSPYLGEQLIISYRLYTRLPVTNYSIEQLPAFAGVWTENITTGRQPRMSTEVIDGIRYNVAEIRRVAVFPQRAGEIRVEPMVVDMAVRLPSERRQRPGSLFDEFFGGSPFDRYQTVSHTARSNTLTLNVKPLPTDNRPGSFKGMVGSYDMEVSLSHQEISLNDAANMVITVRGTGNLRMAEPPEIQFPKHLEVFDPQISDEIQSSDQGISGSRTFDYVIIPRSGGETDIPAVRLTYFDPVRGEYITRSAGPFTIFVEGDYADRQGGIGQVHDGSYLADDIRFIHTRPVPLQTAGKVFFRSSSYYILLALPVLLLVLFLVTRKKYLHRKADVAGMRTRKARKVARNRLKKAAVLLKQQNREAFFDEVFAILWGYVSDRLSMPVSALNKKNVADVFHSKNVPGDLAERFLQGLESCEFARFAPGGQDSPMETTYQTALDTIITLEKELRK